MSAADNLLLTARESLLFHFVPDQWLPLLCQCLLANLVTTPSSMFAQPENNLTLTVSEALTLTLCQTQEDQRQRKILVLCSS